MKINKKMSAKIIIAVLFVTVTLSIVSCKRIKYKHEQRSGINTEIVDTSQFKALSGRLAIKNVSVLSTDSQTMRGGTTVLINQDKIESMGKNISIPNSYQIIDGTGQYLIPGLVDTHVHLHKSKNDLLLYLANGVTHIANMDSWDGLYLKWRQQAEEGALSPKIYVTSAQMSTKNTGIMATLKTWVGYRPGYNTPSQARKAVKEFKSQGYDAIKAYRVTKEVYFAIADEAKKQKIPMAGHLAEELSLEDLYTSGQSQVAHVEEITKASMRGFGGMNSENASEYLKYLNKECDSIAIKLRENNITVSSTINIIESIPKQKFDLPNYLKTIELEHENPGIVEGLWLPGNNGYENPNITNSESKKRSKIFWQTYIKALHIMTKAMVRNGVNITVGTDSIGPGMVAGFSLHDELESLSNVRMTNAQVLHAATLAPAQWMNSNAGKIKDGYRADLVLLAKNPLEDIKNTRSISAVITNGKYLDRTELDKILKSIKQANNRSRKISIDEYIN